MSLTLCHSTLTGRIQSINIQTQVNGVCRPDSIPDLLDNPIDSNCINFPCFHNFKPAISIILVIRRSAQRRADAGVDVGVIFEQALLSGMVEVGAVVDAGDLGGGATEDFGAPWCRLGT